MTHRQRLLLVRHAAAVVSAVASPGEWPLSDDGRFAATELGRRLDGRLSSPTVVASAERKAIETADALGWGEPLVDPRFGEVSKPWYERAEDHRSAAVRYLQGEWLDRWEPRADAIERFGAALMDLGNASRIIATHGTVMSLWLSSVVDVDPVAFWLDLRFPDAWLLTRSDGAASWTLERI